MALPFEGEPISGPVLYLACPLTSVDPTIRKLVDSWCTLITTTVAEAVADSEQPWRVAIHAPAIWSNPARGDARTPEAIYQLNSRKVQDCAGMIVLSTAGGSTGIGQELAWAVALRLPILYLHPHDEPISRQVLGTPGDIIVAAFEDGAGLIDAVRTYLRRQRPVIEDHARRSRSEGIKFARLRADLADAWDRSSDERRTQVEAEARVHKARVAELLEHDNALSLASLSELSALAGALEVPFTPLLPPQPQLQPQPALPELGQREREALALVCDEYEWPGSKALDVELAARRELARGGIRRLTFLTPEDWLRFERDRGNA